MNFLGYVILGGLAYMAGWFIRTKVLGNKPAPKTPYRLTHPVILSYLGGFFVLMLIISFLIGRFILGHNSLDVMFIIINSLAATFVFSFGINPENANYDVPN
ncbi:MULTISPECIES: hypothetical protein [Psychrobacter]|uniref:hypothetical protein n=1 Tax=Psychrobacter TaxID=497 RepID=UPI00146E25D7|nr:MULTISPECIES: hypothetical protein [Psychrobacter]